AGNLGADFQRVDVPNLYWIERPLTVAFPRRAEHRTAIVAVASHLVAEGEIPGQAVLGENLARHGVHFAALQPRSQRLRAFLNAGIHDLECLLDLLGRIGFTWPQEIPGAL